MGELISVIVPIYKVEQYLHRCIDSLLAQTYDNFELILVDDGSPDQCGEICEEYARKDPRIRVIHKTNGGLSDARNTGVSVALGDYIAFVDSDDWVAADYLMEMLNALQLSKSDICECEVLRISKKTILNTGNQSCQSFVYETEQAIELLIKDHNLHQYVWNKLYKRKCIEGILFAVGKTNEDEFWTYQVFGKAQRIVKIDKILYYYFQREESIMGVGYNLKRLDALEAKQQRQAYIDQHFPALSALAKGNLFCTCIYNGQMTLKFLKGEQQFKAKMSIEVLKNCNRPSKKDIKIFARSERLWIRLAIMNFWLTCRLKNLLGKGF